MTSLTAVYLSTFAYDFIRNLLVHGILASTTSHYRGTQKICCGC